MLAKVPKTSIKKNRPGRTRNREGLKSKKDELEHLLTSAIGLP